MCDKTQSFIGMISDIWGSANIEGQIIDNILKFSKKYIILYHPDGTRELIRFVLKFNSNKKLYVGNWDYPSCNIGRDLSLLFPDCQKRVEVSMVRIQNPPKIWFLEDKFPKIKYTN